MELKRRLINFAIKHKYLSLCLVLCVIWVTAAAAVMHFERTFGDGRTSYRTWAASFKAIAICLTSGFDIDPPTTTGALIVAILTLICGVITVGGLIACLTSDLVNQIFFGLKVPVKPASLKLQGHIILFGWGQKTDRIVRELHSDVLRTKRPLVIVSEREERLPLPDSETYRQVWTVLGNPTSDETLQRADVDTAEAVIILADETESNPDAKSLLTCLAVESHNPRVYTCVELERDENCRHFRRIDTDELVSVADISENLLANCAISKGVSRVMYELLTVQKEGNELYVVALPETLLARKATFAEAAAALLPHRVLLVGLQEKPGEGRLGHFAAREGRTRVSHRGKIAINPPHNRPLQPGEKLLVLAFAEPDLTALDL